VGDFARIRASQTRIGKGKVSNSQDILKTQSGGTISVKCEMLPEYRW